MTGTRLASSHPIVVHFVLRSKDTGYAGMNDLRMSVDALKMRGVEPETIVLIHRSRNALAVPVTLEFIYV